MLERFLEDPDLARVKAAVAGLRRFSSSQVCEAMDRAFRAGPDVIRMLVLDNLEVNGSDEMLPLLVEALSYPKVTMKFFLIPRARAFSTPGVGLKSYI